MDMVIITVNNDDVELIERNGAEIHKEVVFKQWGIILLLFLKG